MDLDAAIEAEAQAQAICMQTQDFQRAYEAFVAQAARRCSRATERRSDGMDRAISTGRSSTTRTARSRADLARVGADAASARSDARRRRRRAAARSCARSGDAGWLRYCVPAAHGGALPRARLARAVRRARDARVRTTASPTSRSRCRDWAAARSRSPAATRRSARWLPRGGAGRRRSRRSRCRSRTPARTSRAMTTRARARRRRLGARRQQDVDLQRRHRRLLLRVRAHRRGAGRARASPRSSCPPTRRASTSRSASR